MSAVAESRHYLQLQWTSDCTMKVSIITVKVSSDRIKELRMATILFYKERYEKLANTQLAVSTRQLLRVSLWRATKNTPLSWYSMLPSHHLLSGQGSFSLLRCIIGTLLALYNLESIADSFFCSPLFVSHDASKWTSDKIKEKLIIITLKVSNYRIEELSTLANGLVTGLWRYQ